MTREKPIYNIAVSGLNAIDSPGPGISVIRALRDAEAFDVRIIGLSYESLEPGLYMHELVDHSYQIPYPSAGQQSLYTRLEYIHAREKLDLIIPNFDAELYNFIKLAPKMLSEWGVKSFLPEPDQFKEREKENLVEFGKKHGLLVPDTRVIFESSEIMALGEELGYPFLVKGRYYDGKIAWHADQAVAWFGKISGQWGLPILLQKFVSGTEVNVCGIGDGKGNTIGAIPMRKLYITDKGKAWAGITLDDPEMMKITKQFVRSSKWRGPFELEFIKTEQGEYQLLEINPRFPAWVYLTVGAGQNQVEAMVKLAMGQKVSEFTDYEVGKIFVRYSYDMIVDLVEFERISTLGEL